jgi:hypothetical protein
MVCNSPGLSVTIKQRLARMRWLWTRLFRDMSRRASTPVCDYAERVMFEKKHVIVDRPKRDVSRAPCPPARAVVKCNREERDFPYLMQHEPRTIAGSPGLSTQKA